MEIHCKIDRKEMSEGLGRIRQSLGRVRKNSPKYQLELDIKKDKMHLRVPGADIELSLWASGEGRFRFPLKLLWDLSKNMHTEHLEFTISDQCMVIKHGPRIENSLIEPLDGLETILPELPMNYTDRHILGLRNKYSEKQLKKLGVQQMVEKAEYNYDIALSNAFKHLKQYGVTLTEIRGLADLKINADGD